MSTMTPCAKCRRLIYVGAFHTCPDSACYYHVPLPSPTPPMSTMTFDQWWDWEQAECKSREQVARWAWDESRRYIAQPAQAVEPDAWAWRSDGMTGWALGHNKPTPENTPKFHERHTVVRGLIFADRAVTGAKAGRVDGWRPIETAPKDGRSLILCRQTAFVGSWDADERAWCDNRRSLRDPSHWMPLPASPAPDKEG